MTKKQLHLVIVTGMSGAGKTVAIQPRRFGLFYY